MRKPSPLPQAFSVNAHDEAPFVPAIVMQANHDLWANPHKPKKRLLIIRLPLSKSISQSTANSVRNTKANSRTSHQTSRTELRAKTLLPSSRQDQIRSAPRGRQASAVGFEAVDVEV